MLNETQSASEISSPDWNSDKLQHLCQLYCIPKNNKHTRTYFQALEDLTTLFHTNPHFDHVLIGSGFDGIKPPFHCEEREEGVYEFFFLPHDQTALFIHRHSLALQDSTVQWRPKSPLLYYLCPGSQPATVKLWMSTRTHSNMIQGNYGMLFNNTSAYVHAEVDDNPKFYLSARMFEEIFRGQGLSFLCNNQPHFTTFVTSEDVQDEINVRHMIGDMDNTFHIYPLKQIPAIHCPEWPEAAFGWHSRHRRSGWPSSAIRQQVTHGGCHVIPRNDEDMMHKIDYDWELIFVKAERILVDSLDEEQKAAVSLCQALIQGDTELQDIISNEMILATSCWVFENTSSKDIPSPKILNTVRNIITKLKAFVDKEFIPHYFIPEQNMLTRLPSDVVHDTCDRLSRILQDPVAAIKENKLFLSDDIDNLHERLNNHVSTHTPRYLWNEFQINVQLSVLSFFASMHHHPMPQSIITHRELLKTLEEPFFDKVPHSSVFRKIVQSSLGSLFEAKSTAISTQVERMYYVERAEDLYNLAKDMDLTLGRIRLAMYLMEKKKYHVAMSELSQASMNIAREPLKYEEVLAAQTQQGFSNKENEFELMLWYKFKRGEFCFDVIFTKLLRPLCPSFMNRTVSLAISPLLGLTRKSAAFLESDFFINILLSMCYSALDDVGNANQILQRLSTDVMTVKPKDHNEKRYAAKFIIIGNCYMELGMKKEALTAYTSAKTNYSAIINPARFLMASLEFEDTWKYIKQSVYVAGLASLLSVVFNLVESNM